MTDPDSRTRAAGGSGAIVLARVTVATLLVLAAPAVSFLLTTGILGSGTSIRFPAGYAVMVIVTVLVTVAASALGARIAGRAGFAAIRFVLAWWAVISFAVTVAGIARESSLSHSAVTSRSAEIPHLRRVPMQKLDSSCCIGTTTSP